MIYPQSTLGYQLLLNFFRSCLDCLVTKTSNSFAVIPRRHTLTAYILKLWLWQFFKHHLFCNVPWPFSVGLFWEWTNCPCAPHGQLFYEILMIMAFDNELILLLWWGIQSSLILGCGDELRCFIKVMIIGLSLRFKASLAICMASHIAAGIISLLGELWAQLNKWWSLLTLDNSDVSFGNHLDFYGQLVKRNFSFQVGRILLNNLCCLILYQLNTN